MAKIEISVAKIEISVAKISVAGLTGRKPAGMSYAYCSAALLQRVPGQSRHVVLFSQH